MNQLRIHYYDPDYNEGAWRSIVTPIEGEGLPQPNDTASVLEARRTAWIHSLFPETLGKVMVTVEF